MEINNNKVLDEYKRSESLVELLFEKPVDLETEVDEYMQPIKDHYGPRAECDWRDDRTLWVWINGYPKED